jgi:hypothetical protein
MLESPGIRIRQKLFDAVGPQGERFVFAVLEDDRCAITRDDQLIEVCASDADSIDRAVKRFLHAVHPISRFDASN